MSAPAEGLPGPLAIASVQYQGTNGRRKATYLSYARHSESGRI